jgi:hypothetical protein
VVRMKGHFDGANVMLDEPPPPQLAPGTPVVVLVADGTSDNESPHGSFLEVLERLSGSVHGPTDLSEQHDHYAHGAPKRVPHDD